MSHLSAQLRHMFRTFGWAAFSQFGRYALQLSSLVVLARLLSPQDFGLMALATIVTEFVLWFRDMGTGAALIQRQVTDVSLVRSVFSLNALLSAAAGILTAALAPFIAGFFDAPILAPVLQVLGVSLALAGLGVVPQALLERDRCFDRLARIELGGAAIGAVTGIAMAYNGWAVWSLVGQATVTTLVTTVLLNIASPVLPTLYPDWKLLRGIAGYSLNLVGSHIANYCVRRADDLIIGKLLGPQELGYYALAYRLTIGSVRMIGALLSRVLFPSLARLQHDRPALARACLQAIGLMVSICFPLMALLVALADIGTLALLGDSWRPMVPILIVLGVVGFVQSALVMVSLVYASIGRTDILMRWGLVTGPIAILTFWIGAQWSAFAVAVGFALFMCGVTYPWFRMASRLIGLSVGHAWRATARPATASVVAAVLAWTIARGLAEPFGAMTGLLSGAAAGLLFYSVWYMTALSSTPLANSTR